MFKCRRFFAYSLGISLLQLPLVALAEETGTTGPTGPLPTQPAQIAAEPPIAEPQLATDSGSTSIAVGGAGTVSVVGAPSGSTVGGAGQGSVELRHQRTRMNGLLVRDDDVTVRATLGGGSPGLTAGGDAAARVNVGVRTSGAEGASFCFNGVGETRLGAGYHRPGEANLSLGIMPGLCYANQAGTMVLAGPTLYGRFGVAPDGSLAAAGAGGRVVVIQDEHRVTVEGGHTFAGTGGSSGGAAVRYDRQVTEGSPFIYGASLEWKRIAPPAGGGNQTNDVTAGAYVGVAF